MTADTTQPAGALPEPAIPAVHNGLTATCQAFYSEKQMRTMMAERDAARAERDAALERAEFCLAFTRDAQALCATAQAEAAALLRELEELRKAGAPMANTMFNLAQRDSMPAHERESFKSMQVAWDAALRAIPPDAREGREPQWISVDDERKPPGRTPILVAVAWIRHGEHEDGTPATAEGIDVTEGEYVPMHGDRGGYFESFMGDHGDSFGVTHWMPLPAAPAGTSADGETQP